MRSKILYLIAILFLVNQGLNAQDAFLAENKSTPQPLDSPYEKTPKEAMPVLAYDHIREADVFWEKRIWRVIDVREKMNKSFSAPQNPLISVLLRGIACGEITPYGTLDDKFSTPMTREEIDKQINTLDTIRSIDPDTYTETIRVVRDDFNPEDVKRFRIKEVWFFDSETSTMNVRILGIAPLKEDYDENGIMRFEYPMFWVYYPHIRKYLAGEEAVNPIDDAHPLTWEHLMEARFFSSYIIKESNVDDRRIQDYKVGEEALYESLKIEEEMMNFEHDLWSY